MALPTKNELRKKFLDQRNALDAAVRTRNSSLIRQWVFTHKDWRSASVILCYVSFGSEVDTQALIQEALRYKKRIVVPLIGSDAHETALSELHRFPDLVVGPRGVKVPRPEAQSRVDPSEVELALIPGVVFDRAGRRIGFGGGYFDRLLPQMPQARRMGLAYAQQISSLPLPQESFDVPMQVVITEREVIEVESQ